MNVLKKFCEKINWDDSQLKLILDTLSMEEVVSQLIEWYKIEDYYAADFARQFYISARLPEVEKGLFYDLLMENGFFALVKGSLYSENINSCGASIYTIGKFTHYNQIVYLEKAYEEYFEPNNFILSESCLFEMDWLRSKKVSGYLKALWKKNSLLSKLTLLGYYSRLERGKEYEGLIHDEELLFFVNPLKDPAVDSSFVESRLSNLKNHLGDYLPQKGGIRISYGEIKEIASHYFKDYKDIPRSEREQWARDFEKLLASMRNSKS